MHKSRRLKITDINPHLICVLCSGYLIDATTIIECLHSFCRGCIVKYLESNKYCPICDVQVHKTKPLLNIRSDQTLQDIVYKLVPGLFQNEMCRRRDFYSQHPEHKPSSAEESGEVTQFSHIYTADESISLSLEYYNNNDSNDSDGNTETKMLKAHPSRRYLRCPAAVSVSHLQKLIRAKYGLSNEHRVDIMYMNDRLSEDFTLMDIAYIYLWRRKVPLHLTYRIFEVAKRIKLEEIEEKPVKTEETEDLNKAWKEVQLQISENGIMSVTNIEETKPVETVEKVKVEITPEVKTIIKDEKPVIIEKPPEEKKEEKILLSDDTATKEKIIEKEEPKEEKEKDVIVKPGKKHKLDETSIDNNETNVKIMKPSPPAVPIVSKPQILPLKNVQQLSRNHPLKIHSQTVKNNLPQNIPISKPLIQNKPQQQQNQSKIFPQTSNTNNNILHNNNNNNKSNNINNKTLLPVTSSMTSVQNNTQTIQNTIPKTVSVTSINQNAAESVLETVTTPKLTVVTDSKPSLNNMQNTPKYTQASQSNENTTTTNTKYAETSIQHSIQRLPVTTSSIQPSLNNCIQTSKVSIVPKKSPLKLGAPIGYKTLRDPPKAWNPQISRQSLVKANTYTSTTIASTSDSKTDSKVINIQSKPAKFFKMRNNMPRYLGNPASGVKPMYQVREGDKSPPTDIRKTSLEPNKKQLKPESEKTETEVAPIASKIKIDKIEVKKHGNIIKIDPKTLQPISDKPQEAPSCSDTVVEMKINQSTVPILNPLRSQKAQTSPKIDRRSPKAYLDIQNSPKSPLERSSPKINSKIQSTQSSSKSLLTPTSKKDKLNINFTPPNPFIPNLTSPNMAPNQFLYPNFPSYDPRVMNNLNNLSPYHNLPLSLSMFYSQPRLNYSGLTSQNLPLSSTLMSGLEVSKNLRLTKTYDIPSMTQLSSTLELRKSSASPINKRVDSPSYNGEKTEKLNVGKNNNSKSFKLNEKPVVEIPKPEKIDESKLKTEINTNKNRVEKEVADSKTKLDDSVIKDDKKVDKIDKKEIKVADKAESDNKSNEMTTKENITRAEEAKDKINKIVDKPVSSETDKNIST